MIPQQRAGAEFDRVAEAFKAAAGPQESE